MVGRGAAMKSKIVFGTIAALLLTLFSFTPVQAAASVVTAPTIAPLANGKSIVATPAKWSATVKSSYKWLLNGKSVAGTKTSFTPTAKQKGAFTDATSTKISVTLAPAVPANAKAKVTWFRGPFEVKEATGLTYEVATADQDSEITVSVVYAAKGYTPAKLISTGIVIPMQERKYSLMWSDEFDASASSTVDPSIWVPQNGDGVAFGNKGWGNRERQWYLDTQSKIDSTGALTISATRTGAEALNCYYKAPCEWISSKFVTKDRVGFKYGRIEARIKGSVGTGTWGAFWLLGANIDDRGWPGCGEIDVAELLGRDPKKNYGTLHGPLSGGGGRGDTVAMDNGFANDYHTYAIDWLPDQITWYLDGQLFATVNKTDKDWVFDHEFYLIMNLAMGGIFGGDIDPAVKDATMSFDYVRAYQINGVGEVIKH